MMTEGTFDQTVQDSCHNLQRIAVASRDALLFAVSSRADEDTLRRVCQEVANQLGGQAAVLSQLLAQHGCRPLPTDDPRMDRLRASLVASVPPASTPVRAHRSAQPPEPAAAKDPERNPKLPARRTRSAVRATSR